LAFHGHGAGTNIIVQFHVWVHKFYKVLWFFGLVNKACLEFSGKITFEGSLLYNPTIVQDGYQALELYVVLAKLLISLSELVELRRSSSYLVRVTKGGLKNRDKCFHIFKVDFIREDVRLDLILCIAFKEAIYIAEFVLIIDISWAFSSKF
jgi:hypothetical protein